MRIAVASSGLGHIRRGIETWAADTARGLHTAGCDVTLFQGAGQPTEPWQQTLPCKRRFDPDVERWVKRLRRLGGWRYGFANGYQMEQTTFTLHLWRRIRRDFDILHVQDPWIAWLMERLYRLKLSRPQVILAHGTEEQDGFLHRFTSLQHLAPCYVAAYDAERPQQQKVFAIPNFVNIDQFQPGNKQNARNRWQLPEDNLIILCVAALKKQHKRIDYLLHEFATFLSLNKLCATLVVAGSREAETTEVINLGKSLLGEQVLFLEGVDRQDIPSLYQAADIFALASLHEMMPIALLEALASGLPITCNDTPTLRWMAGAAGNLQDISQDGGLVSQWNHLVSPAQRKVCTQAARAHAVNTFSETVVIQQIQEMYHQVIDTKK